MKRAKVAALLAAAVLLLGGCSPIKCFADFEPGPAFPEGPQDLPYPRIDAHAIARIWLDKDDLRIRFLDEKWALNQIHEGKFTLSHFEAPTALVVTARTEELRKFAAEHA